MIDQEKIGFTKISSTVAALGSVKNMTHLGVLMVISRAVLAKNVEIFDMNMTQGCSCSAFSCFFCRLLCINAEKIEPCNMAQNAFAALHDSTMTRSAHGLF